ncbi:Homocysteine S-methyltransferase [Gloeophyllum trabeum ATCC 11539]|uniref:Homocysteine S-methyltransferase n=1 Tax=Gloeophyllum trabeum (strain ATCC 11539 / FP-39264 / Madison 617) TaxID=670483 RepID=S7RR85_GLOTA|nr:Homocysteine S-methyltransferase [Gloeophyllum trabeum ATCC 11539]EPQ57135.1 Homocysteine S-methyltransferase [Gloeophyllum trabeum ATCC 11539]
MTAVSNLWHLFGKSLVTLDGGLGTTLEDVFHKDISHTPLWSAKPIDGDPEAIIAVHLAFLRAGARVILTSTYQCAHETFHRAGYTREDARRIMTKAVMLAVEARKRFLQEENTDTHPSIKIAIALSLGPFGATLSPAQEFDGFYPPPYGPRGYEPDGNNVNTFAAAEEGKEDSAIHALCQFHLERLLVFASDLDVWSSIDCLAFETVPLIREVKAIRKAVTALYQGHSGPGASKKPWWISTVFPDGRYPQAKLLDGRPVRAADVVEAVLGPDNDALRPDGYGINCTASTFLAGLVSEATIKAKELADARKLWLVLYPNGGDTYDPITQKWIEGRDGKKWEWAEDLYNTIQIARRSGFWEGIVAGGCCRTGPDEIQALVGKLSIE